MILARRLGIVVAAAMLAGACGGTPDRPSDFLIDPPSPVTSVYRGTVLDEDDRPVADAKVTYHVPSQSQSATAATVVTDVGGVFEFTVVSHQPAFRALVVTVEKAGHEPTTGWATPNCCDGVRLYRIREIAAGDTVALTLFGGAYCGREYEVPCRRVRVRSPHVGTLRLQVDPDTFWVVPADAAPFLNPSDASSLSVPVEAQSVTAIDVWSVGRVDDTGTAFTLTTSIQ